MSKKVLVVVDMQNDFVFGSLANPAAQEIIPQIKSEIESDKYQKVLFTKDTHHSDYLNTYEGKHLPVEHCQYQTPGWDVVDGLKEFSNENNTILKPTFGFIDWRNVLDEEYDEIVVVGTCTDICVVSNAIILHTTFPETKVTVFSSCCAGLTPEKHEAALSVMESCQINVE